MSPFKICSLLTQQRIFGATGLACIRDDYSLTLTFPLLPCIKGLFDHTHCNKLKVAFFPCTLHTTHLLVIRHSTQPYSPPTLQRLSNLRCIASSLLETVSGLAAFDVADSTDMDLDDATLEHHLTVSSQAATGPSNSITNVEDTKQGSTRSLVGIAGWLKNHRIFDPTMCAHPGSTFLHTDGRDEFGDNIVVVVQTPEDITSLNHPSVFLSKDSVSSRFSGVNEVTTHKRPATNVPWIEVIPDDEKPYADGDLIKSLVSSKLPWALGSVYPVQVHIRVEYPAGGSQIQDTTASQD
jgi:hypothetical protein